jgi:hypothetical protein
MLNKENQDRIFFARVAFKAIFIRIILHQKKKV